MQKCQPLRAMMGPRKTDDVIRDVLLAILGGLAEILLFWAVY
jgi:hypothetical protein